MKALKLFSHALALADTARFKSFSDLNLALTPGERELADASWGDAEKLCIHLRCVEAHRRDHHAA